MQPGFDPNLINPRAIDPEIAEDEKDGTVSVIQAGAELRRANQAKESLRNEAADWESRIKGEQVKDLSAARIQRTIYAAATFFVVIIWIVLVWYVLRMQFWSDKWGLRHLSDAVLITFLTTTTANIIGMFLIVLRSIFRAPDSALDR